MLKQNDPEKSLLLYKRAIDVAEVSNHPNRYIMVNNTTRYISRLKINTMKWLHYLSIVYQLQ